MDVGKVIHEAFQENVEVLGEKNKEQLSAGKNKQGTDITPGYLDDPYFKSRESAQRYSLWKDKITPNPLRKSGTPNLFINGAYYKSRRVVLSGDTLQYSADFLGAEIERKYGDQVDGLGGEFKKDFLDKNLRPALNRRISNATGLKFK